MCTEANSYSHLPGCFLSTAVCPDPGLEVNTPKDIRKECLSKSLLLQFRTGISANIIDMNPGLELLGGAATNAEMIN